MDSKVSSLLAFLDVLKDSAKSESIDRVVAQVVDTLENAAFGRIDGIPSRIRDDIRDALDDWNLAQAEEDERKSYIRANNPEGS